MTRCSQAGCTNSDLKAYKVALRQQYVVLCGACHADLTAMSFHLIPTERRETNLPVIEERRRSFRPAWLDRLRGRDETGWIA